jgi:cystathionine beta-lyase
MSKKSPGGPRHPGVKPATRFVTGGRDPQAFHGFVNPPVVHASTVLYPTVDDYEARRGRYTYGRRGTPTSEAFATGLAEVEGPECAGVALLPSGLAAAALALQSVAQSGDHVLVTDNVYGPTRKYCDTVLNRAGVTTTYFDPLIADITPLMQPNTRAVYLESPGSLSFEVQDVPAIAKAVHARGAIVLMDNTWASPLYFRALEKGVDLAIQSGSKYIGGHADVMLGVVAANAKCWPLLNDTVFTMGLCVGPDVMYLGMRGLRTMALRLAQHYRAGLKAARWLTQRPEVATVLHPALESCPGHAIWKRDFTGASGLFSIILKPAPQKAVHAFIDALALFGIGASWGGFESLVIPFDCGDVRSATTFSPGGPAVRFHIGLEDVDDLIADLERGFAAFAAAR